MVNVLIILVIAAIVTLAGRHLHKARKRGARCIGCPCGGECGKKTEKPGCCR